jgi:hypothetical protein
MLSHCANSKCGKPFLKLRDGKLFLVEIGRTGRLGESLHPSFDQARQQQRMVEHYWLCDECAKQWTLIYDSDRGVTLNPLRRPVLNTATKAMKNGAA